MWQWPRVWDATMVYNTMSWLAKIGIARCVEVGHSSKVGIFAMRTSDSQNSLPKPSMKVHKAGGRPQANNANQTQRKWRGTPAIQQWWPVDTAATRAGVIEGSQRRAHEIDAMQEPRAVNSNSGGADYDRGANAGGELTTGYPGRNQGHAMYGST